MNWREQVEEALRGRDKRDTRDKSPPSGAISGPNVPNVPNVPSVPSVPTNPAKLLREWEAGLTPLDPGEAPDGFEGREYWQLWLDACWLFEAHGRYAALNGWDTQALFGVFVGYPAAGGLAQQLRGSRQLVFDGPRAVYRQWGVSCPINIGIARGLPAIWEIGNDATRQATLGGD